MSTWKNIGEYLGRNVRLLVCDNQILDFPSKSLNDSVLLIVSAMRQEKDLDFQNLLLCLINALPLALAVYEHDSMLIFDRIIHLLSTSSAKPDIMTKAIHAKDYSEALSDFLFSTWPSEEQFDKWRSYSIICFHKSVADSITKEVGRRKSES